MVLMVFFAGQSMAAILLVQNSTEAATGSAKSLQTSAFASNPVIGNTIIVTAWTYNATASTPSLTVTDTAGNIYTQIVQKSVTTSGFQQTAIFSAPVTVTGASFKVTITAGATASQIEAMAFEYSGLASGVDKTGASSGTTNVLSVSTGVATSAANELVVSALSIRTPVVTFTALANTSGTQRMFQKDNSAFSAGQSSDQIINATGIQTQTWNGNPSTGTWLWAAVIATFKASTIPPNHYELSVPTSSINCLPSTVTVTACATSTTPCASPYTSASGTVATLSTTGASLGSNSVTFNASGVASTTLSYPLSPNATVVAVNLTGVPSAQTGTNQCCPNGSSCTAASSCSTTFNTSGFIFGNAAGSAGYTIPTQIAGSTSTSNTGNLFLRAVKTGSTTQACEAALVGTNPVSWSAQCNDPSTCSAGTLMSLSGGSTTAIGASPIATGSTPATAVAMTFDANGNAPFSFNYADVGQVTLYAASAASGSLLSSLTGNTNAFVVKPAGFVISNIKCATLSAGNCSSALVGASSATNPAASSATGGAFIQAGNNFSATVTATITGGAAAPNYGKESAPDGVKLTATRVLPASGGASPALTNPTAFGLFSGGSATGTTFQWNEVGIITLTPSVGDANYLGTGDVIGTASGNVGRFIPDSFSSSLTPGCSSGAAFTYSGQPFAYSVTARNASGGTIVNYDSSTGFSKAVTGTMQGALSGIPASLALASSAFTAGVATLTTATGPAYTYTAKKTAPSTLSIRDVDTDSVTSDPAYGGVESGMLLRSGQLKIYGSSGGDKSILFSPLALQYWDGLAWVVNSDDGCTSLTAANIALTGKTNAAATYVAGAPVLASGIGYVPVTPSIASGSAAGTVSIAVDLGSSGVDLSCQAAHGASAASLVWLRSYNGSCSANPDRDPSGQLSFGTYTNEAKRQVYIREMR